MLLGVMPNAVGATLGGTEASHHFGLSERAKIDV